MPAKWCLGTDRTSAVVAIVGAGNEVVPVSACALCGMRVACEGAVAPIALVVLLVCVEPAVLVGIVRTSLPIVLQTAMLAVIPALAPEVTVVTTGRAIDRVDWASTAIALL